MVLKLDTTHGKIGNWERSLYVLPEYLLINIKYSKLLSFPLSHLEVKSLLIKSCLLFLMTSTPFKLLRKISRSFLWNKLKKYDLSRVKISKAVCLRIYLRVNTVGEKSFTSFKFIILFFYSFRRKCLLVDRLYYRPAGLKFSLTLLN